MTASNAMNHPSAVYAFPELKTSSGMDSAFSLVLVCLTPDNPSGSDSYCAKVVQYVLHHAPIGEADRVDRSAAGLRWMCHEQEHCVGDFLYLSGRRPVFEGQPGRLNAHNEFKNGI